MRSRLSMTIRPGEGRSEAPSTATERGRRSGARSIARGAFGASESALIGRPPRDAGSGAKSRGAAERGLDVLHRPGIARGRAGDPPLPVRRTEPPHDAVELGELTSRSGDDLRARMSHVR